MLMETAARLVKVGMLPVMAGIAVGGGALARSDTARPWVWLAVLAGIGLSFAAERIAPYRPDWNRPVGDGRRDIAHALVNEGSILVVLAALPVIADRLTLVDRWPHRWPFAAQVATAVVVADLGITLAHRVSHRVGWLWRLHAVHHSVTRFYGFNGLMKHPLHQTIELLAGVGPLLIVGLPPEVAAALAVCVAVQLLLQHSNVDYACGGLDRWLALNRPHRFHHLAAAGEGDVNFGLFFTVWDRYLLGTYAEDPARRFTSADLGVSGRPDFPVRYLAQLADPFRQRPSALPLS